MTVPLILIIDDEKKLVESLEFGLSNAGFETKGAFDGESGLLLAKQIKPDIIFLDLRLPDLPGLEVLGRLKVLLPKTPVVMISAYGETRTAVQAVKAGANDFLTKPFELDELIHLVRATADRERLAEEVTYLRERNLRQEQLIGESVAMRNLCEQLERIARSRVQMVLLTGPSGTGKSVVARMIHAASERKSDPFVEVNCASLPEQLLEAELFGAEKGAYTGASERRPGLVKLADHGTLFLDEIGELPLNLQAKFLHFLESHTYRPLGNSREFKADVRVVTATNHDLSEDVTQGRFREDLFYRVNVMPLVLPTLRERGEDLFLLLNHFSGEYAKAERCAQIMFSEEVQEIFASYTWPGNVRELRNLVERLTILNPGETITSAHLPLEFMEHTRQSVSMIEERLANTERTLLLQTLKKTDGRKGEAADLLGISRHTLKRKMQRLKIV